MASRREMRARDGSSGPRRSARTERSSNGYSGPRYRGGSGSRYDPPSNPRQTNYSGGYSSGPRREYRRSERNNRAGGIYVLVAIAIIVGGIYVIYKLNGG